MHYYPHNIPDFNNATRHLTRVERSVYRDAIEHYYDTEQPLPGGDFDRLARLLLCSTKEEKDALQYVLSEFFDLSEGQYYHRRCESEIEKYRLNSTAKAKAGRASAEARKNKSSTQLQQNSTRVEQLLNSVEQTKNQELRTKNQELKTNNKKNIQKKIPPPATLDFTQWPEQPSKQIWDDFVTLRKNKKAPITQTVINQIGKELIQCRMNGFSVDQVLSVMIMRNWQGVKLEWILQHFNNPQQINGKQFLNSRERDAIRAEETFDYQKGTDFGDPHCG